MRALSPTTPTYIFPAMNTLMYEHPLTVEHLRIVKEVIKYNVVGPIGKPLACGDIGQHFGSTQHVLSQTLCAAGLGAMTEWKDIVDIVVEAFNLQLKPGSIQGQS